MATFEAGAIPSSFGNVLFDPMKVDQAVQSQQHNALMMDATRQQMGRQTEADSREHAAQAAGYILSLGDEQQPTAYKALLANARASGHAFPNAPAEYPGKQYMQMLLSQGIPAEQQYKMGVNRDSVNAAWPGGGAPAPGGAPVAGGTAPAATGAPVVPPELMPHFQEASARTGIPVATLAAQAQQESSMGKTSPNIMQILDSTARDPGFGMTGVDPAALRDPRANINFGADYLKARAGGGDMADPAVRDAALKAYNGGGDPNYVANVGRYLPGGGASGGGQGVAGRTPGAVDYAGPGAPPAATVSARGDYTPAQQQVLDSMRANPNSNTAAAIYAMREKFNDDNRQAAQHAFEQARQTENDRLARVQTERENLRHDAADKRLADEDKRKADAAGKDYQGSAIEAQDGNILNAGDDGSRRYAGAYARQAAPKTVEGVTTNPNMDAYDKPTFAGGKGVVGSVDYARPTVTVGADPVALRKMEVGAAALLGALDTFQEKAKNASAAERLATVAGQPTGLATAWNGAALLAKGDELFKLGVLSGPDYDILKKALAHPGTFMGAMASDATIADQVGQLKKIINAGIDAQRNYKAGGPAAPAANAAAAKAQPQYQEGQTATGPNGAKLTFRDGRWQAPMRPAGIPGQ